MRRACPFRACPSPPGRTARPSLLGALVQGLGLGGGLIIAIGAQNAYVLRQGLRHEFAMAVATVCFLCDVALIALGAGGFGSLVAAFPALTTVRSEEHTSELQSLMRISYAVFCLKTKRNN